MNQSLKEFGHRLDGIAATGAGVVNEGNENVVVSGLSVSGARTLAELAGGANLVWSAEDDANTSVFDVEQFDEDLTPYRLTIDKPKNGGAFVLFTIGALPRFLDRDPNSIEWKHVQSSHGFSTVARRFSLWDEHVGVKKDEVQRPNPRDLVRESGEPTAPARIAPWLLDMPLSHLPDADPVFSVWAEISIQASFRSLATEILADGTIVYTGPPKLKVRPSQLPPSSNELLIALQKAVKWVYDTDHHAEIRHGLIGAELGRHCTDKTIVASAVLAALEGAKIAYQLSLSGVSKDSLKAIADVRKAVTEEINKTADTARQLATAVAGSVFLGLGVVAARVSSTAPPALLIALSMVLAVYVGAMIFASNHFMGLQESLRSDWKQRFFGFLGADDYKTLVTDPLKKAKSGYSVVSWVAGSISIIMVVAVVLFVTWGADGQDPGVEVPGIPAVSDPDGQENPT